MKQFPMKWLRLGATGFLLGAVAMLVVQALLIWAFFAASNQDPFVLNPNSGSLKKNGLTMVMFCGSGHTPDGRHSESLKGLPPKGNLGGWSRGREVWGNCDIWYQHDLMYNPYGEAGENWF
jgi:hypothetical protein